MLDVEEHFVIKDLYRSGVSISEIARRTGHDRKTVRKLATTPLAAHHRRRSPTRPGKLDPFVAYLERRLQAGVTNAAKLFREIQAQGYTGKYTRVKDWLHTRRPRQSPLAVTRFETAPGEQAQVDFASFGTIEHLGRQHRLSAFLMTLGWSRMLFVRFFVSCDWVAFLRGHLEAFSYFGGVPRTVLHDNLKSAVLERRSGQVHFHPRYLDFADYYGFTPKACRPYRAQTKGKVERSVQYLRGNFWQGVSFRDLDDLNAQVSVWLDTVANVRVHATTRVTPRSRLEAEGLLSISSQPSYAVTPVVVRQASRDGWVRYSGNAYAVPLHAAATSVLVHLGTTNDLTITTATGTALAHYPLASGNGKTVGQPTSLTVEPLTHSSALPVAALPAPLVERRELREYDVLVEGV